MIYFDDLSIPLLLQAFFFSVSWDSLLLLLSCFMYVLWFKLTAAYIFVMPFTTACALHKCNHVPHYIYSGDGDLVGFPCSLSPEHQLHFCLPIYKQGNYPQKILSCFFWRVEMEGIILCLGLQATVLSLKQLSK